MHPPTARASARSRGPPGFARPRTSTIPAATSSTPSTPSAEMRPPSVGALGGRISALGVLGVLLVAAGIVLVRGLANPGGPRDLALALAVGGCIASYTLVDKRGIIHG